MEQEKKEQEARRQANLPILYKGTAGTRVKGILMTTFGGIFTGGMGVGAAVLLITGAVLEPGLMAGGAVNGSDCFSQEAAFLQEESEALIK